MSKKSTNFEELLTDLGKQIDAFIADAGKEKNKLTDEVEEKISELHTKFHHVKSKLQSEEAKSHWEAAKDHLEQSIKEIRSALGFK